MAEGRKLAGLDKDRQFLGEVVALALTLQDHERVPGGEVEHFKRVLGLAVHEVLSEKGVEPRLYRGVVRRFVENVHVSEGEATRLIQQHAPVEDIQKRALLRLLASMRPSVSLQSPEFEDKMVEYFNLKLLAGGLDMREQILLSREVKDVDHLTQLLNRQGMEAYLADLLEQDPDLSGALLLMDVDHFKNVNDRWGHPEGDRALVYVAERFSDTVRLDPDAVVRMADELEPENAPTAVRWGGEEMVAFLPGVPSLEVAAAIAERVRRVISDGSGAVLGFPLTVTIGATVGPFSDYENLFRTADGLMYKGKAEGRNRVVTGPHTVGEAPDRSVRSHATIVPK